MLQLNLFCLDHKNNKIDNRHARLVNILPKALVDSGAYDNSVTYCCTGFGTTSSVRWPVRWISPGWGGRWGDLTAAPPRSVPGGAPA